MSANLFDALMSGDMNRVMREMETSRQERERKNMEAFTDAFRGAMQAELRPALAFYLRRSGSHEPRCGLNVKGDLLRWVTESFHGKSYRVPTIRHDYVELAIDGKIQVKGMELLDWIVTKLDHETRNLFIAVRRAQVKQEKQ